MVARFGIGAALVGAVLAGVAGTELWHQSRTSSPSARRAKLPLTVTSLGSPATAALEPQAVRLCELLHALPGRRAAACCGSTPNKLGFDQCVSLTSRALQSGAIRLDPAALDACARATDAALSGCDWVGPRPPAPPAVCAEVIRGVGQLGEPCTSSLECQTPLHCSVSDSPHLASGRCTAAEPLGKICERADDAFAAFTRNSRSLAERPSCVTGFCSAATRRCAEKPAEGAACRASSHCTADQRCQDGACRTTGESALAHTGEACGSDFDCEQGGCVPTPDGAGRICGMSCPTPNADLLGLKRPDRVTLGLHR
jgi:hypothetical protein